MEHWERDGASPRALLEKLERDRRLAREEWRFLLEHAAAEDMAFARERAGAAARARFGSRVYTRGLIEFTNYCKNDCLYCGIRRGNRRAERYRLTQEEILACCQAGYGLGFRTFVLQGGEDPYFTDERLCALVGEIKARWPGCAVTLSVGERSRASYQALFDAGADRYLLRHETADSAHYRRLHPPELSLENRKRCLWDLKEIGYQVGTGFMVGSPGQTADCLAQDLCFIRELSPAMVGIGPFVPHRDTPLGAEPAGSAEQTLFLVALLRLMLPDALIPATTALGTLLENGREQGVLSGANVVMPNLSPVGVRRKYTLYDNKICMDEEAAEGRAALERRMAAIGFTLPAERGDYRPAGPCPGGNSLAQRAQKEE